jgi:hypothetical protein
MIALYAGPTISRADVPSVPNLVWLPPASQGDVFALVEENRPWSIGIIDGYFERSPAVSHKEILWAMSQGVHVYGAASMGALRAAELEAFGMVGIGSIFEDYRNGVLEDDDEVAVAHGPASEKYRAGSEAMVNIRATIQHAVRSGILGASEAELLIRIAKETFYPMRHYGDILHRAIGERLWPETATRFRSWIKTGRIDRKHDDALLLVNTLARRFRRKPALKKVLFHFHRTQMWDYAINKGGERNGAAMDERL